MLASKHTRPCKYEPKYILNLKKKTCQKKIKRGHNLNLFVLTCWYKIVFVKDVVGTC